LVKRSTLDKIRTESDVGITYWLLRRFVCKANCLRISKLQVVLYLVFVSGCLLEWPDNEWSHPGNTGSDVCCTVCFFYTALPHQYSGVVSFRIYPL